MQMPPTEFISDGPTIFTWLLIGAAVFGVVEAILHRVRYGREAGWERLKEAFTLFAFIVGFVIFGLVVNGLVR